MPSGECATQEKLRNCLRSWFAAESVELMIADLAAAQPTPAHRIVFVKCNAGQYRRTPPVDAHVAYFHGRDGQELLVDQPRGKHRPVKRWPALAEQVAYTITLLQERDSLYEIDSLPCRVNPEDLHARVPLRLQPAGSLVRRQHGRVHELAVEDRIIAQLEVGARRHQHIALPATSQAAAQLLQLRVHDAKDRAARPGTLQSLLCTQSPHAENHRVGMGT